jgi:hypothetical protein
MQVDRAKEEIELRLNHDTQAILRQYEARLQSVKKAIVALEAEQAVVEKKEVLVITATLPATRLLRCGTLRWSTVPRFTFLVRSNQRRSRLREGEH